MTKTFTATEIKARVAAPRATWPPPDTLASWKSLHDAVDLLHYVVSGVNDDVARIEANSDLSPDGIARQRADIGAKALQELESFGPLRKAEKAVGENIEYLNEKMTGLPKPPSDFMESIMAVEVRGIVRSQQHPTNFVLSNLADPRVVGAVLNAPAALSGLKDEEVAIVRDKARTQLHPKEHAMQQQLEKALADLHTGVENSKRMIRERTAT
jgi:hypothetical protein